jgi:putative Ca2+/H+ antiporter (TMEM165/GDT1 family)
MNEPRVVVVGNKSVMLALILTFFFGPLGMLYSTILGGIVMLVLAAVVGFFTAGFGLFFVWPIQMLWAGIAAGNYNKSQLANVQRQMRG